ncbi:insulinase family protein [Patescibacteria group bacterium]|nr:insulinase family protein [Patescibacteria group bacterium]
MYKKTVASSGLRIITEKLESTKAVTVLVLAGAGSRYETKDINGIAHFLEHMFFKGAEKFENARAVSETIDSIGGSFNAFTGKEYAGYYVKVASEHLEIAMDVLSDMMLHAKFDKEEIEKERGVILEEYNMYQDTPMYQIGWDFERLMFGDQPLGWDQIGTVELIKSVTKEQFQDYKKRFYTPDNMVLTLAGDIEHDKAVELANKYFAFNQNEGKANNFDVWKEFKKDEKVYLHEKKTEQAHIVVGVQSYPETHENHWAEKLLGIILGGNMSSRMFLSVREARGLCYYISSHSDNFSDCGIFSTSAGVRVGAVDEAITAIIEEYRKIKAEKIPQSELDKAKNFIKGKMILKLEDSEEYAHLLGKFELLHNDIMTPDQILAEIEKITVDDIHKVAQDLFKPENIKIGVIGPYDDKTHFENLLK